MMNDKERIEQLEAELEKAREEAQTAMGWVYSLANTTDRAAMLSHQRLHAVWLWCRGRSFTRSGAENAIRRGGLVAPPSNWLVLQKNKGLLHRTERGLYRLSRQGKAMVRVYAVWSGLDDVPEHNRDHPGPWRVVVRENLNGGVHFAYSVGIFDADDIAVLWLPAVPREQSFATLAARIILAKRIIKGTKGA